MTGPVLLDTGPLVAIISLRDPCHAVCNTQLQHLRPPLLTTWAVLTKAMWMLRRYPQAIRRMHHCVRIGMFTLPVLDETALVWMLGFCQRYADCSPQLADASLVYLAERERIDTVFTLDRRDFSIYRIGKHRCFRLLPKHL